MAANLLNELENLERSLEALAGKYRKLEQRNRMLEEENANLKREASEARESRDRALKDVEFLAVSHKLADDPDTLVVARRHIAHLIRNIDRCLDMLKE